MRTISTYGRLCLSILASLVFTSACGLLSTSNPEVAARSAFEKWARQVGVPYKNVSYQITQNDGTFATVRVQATLRESKTEDWLKKKADVECRRVGSEWQCSLVFEFGLTEAEQARQKQIASGTATAVAIKLQATATEQSRQAEATRQALIVTQAALKQNTNATATAVALTATATALAPQPPVATHTQVDEFDMPTLDSSWYWINEDPTHWSLTAQPGWLQITSQAGEIWQGNNLGVRNVLLRKFSDSPSNIAIITKLAFVPSINWQSAGLVIYNSDDDYITLLYGYHTDFGGKSVRFQSEEKGRGQQIGIAFSSSSPVIYLKIVKTGNSYTGYFSLDNSTWIQVGKHINKMNTSSVGLITNNGTGIQQKAKAAFDYFQLIR